MSSRSLLSASFFCEHCQKDAKFLPIHFAHALAGVSRRTIYYWMQRGWIHCFASNSMLMNNFPPFYINYRGGVPPANQEFFCSQQGPIECCLQSRRDDIAIAQGGSPGNCWGFRQSPGGATQTDPGNARLLTTRTGGFVIDTPERAVVLALQPFCQWE